MVINVYDFIYLSHKHPTQSIIDNVLAIVKITYTIQDYAKL